MEPMMEKGDALILVEVQRDFCCGGALPVPDGDAVVPVLNRWIEAAQRVGALIYASRDWHPEGHVSFRGSGGLWPPHCVQDSPGAMFHPDLRLPPHVPIVTKGVRFDKDQYSAFDDTGFAVELRRRAVRRLWVGGLALDVCVKATVLDAERLGFEVTVVREGTRALTREGGEAAVAEMKRAGARMTE